jgi:hypothetical protein
MVPKLCPSIGSAALPGAALVPAGSAEPADPSVVPVGWQPVAVPPRATSTQAPDTASAAVGVPTDAVAAVTARACATGAVRTVRVTGVAVASAACTEPLLLMSTTVGVDTPSCTSTVPVSVVPVAVSSAYAAALLSSQAPATKPATVRPRRIHRFICSTCQFEWGRPDGARIGSVNPESWQASVGSNGRSRWRSTRPAPLVWRTRAEWDVRVEHS